MIDSHWKQLIANNVVENCRAEAEDEAQWSIFPADAIA